MILGQVDVRQLESLVMFHLKILMVVVFFSFSKLGYVREEVKKGKVVRKVRCTCHPCSWQREQDEMRHALLHRAAWLAWAKNWSVLELPLGELEL